jgi:hypothetical protein
LGQKAGLVGMDFLLWLNPCHTKRDFVSAACRFHNLRGTKK